MKPRQPAVRRKGANSGRTILEDESRVDPKTPGLSQPARTVPSPFALALPRVGYADTLSSTASVERVFLWALALLSPGTVGVAMDAPGVLGAWTYQHAEENDDDGRCARGYTGRAGPTGWVGR